MLINYTPRSLDRTVLNAFSFKVYYQYNSLWLLAILDFFPSKFSKQKKNSENCQAVVWLYFVTESVIIAVTFA